MSVTIVRNDTSESVQFDVVTAEAHDPQVRVFKHPIEQGTDVTDHVEAELMVYSLTGQVVAAPFVRVGEELPTKGRQFAARDFFRRAVGKELSVVSIRYGVLSPYVLEAYPHEPQPSDATQFEITLSEARFAEATTADIPPDVAASAGLASAEDVGNQATDERSPLATQEDPESVFFRPNVPERFLQPKTFEGEANTDSEAAGSWGVQLLEL